LPALQTSSLSAEPCIDPEPAGTLSEQLEALERRIISRVMEAAAGNQSEAARRLGLNRGSLIHPAQEIRPRDA